MAHLLVGTFHTLLARAGDRGSAAARKLPPRGGNSRVRDAVWNGMMSINKAYEQVRAPRSGRAVTKDKAAAAYRRAVEKTFSLEKFAFLDSLGSDLAFHVGATHKGE